MLYQLSYEATLLGAGQFVGLITLPVKDPVKDGMNVHLNFGL